MGMISQERLDAYAATASTFGDIPGLLTAIGVMSADWVTLKAEGRTNALTGADRLLAGCVRRLCATAARSEKEAEAKRDTLGQLREFYNSGNGGAAVLMGAMIDAAVAFEIEAWRRSSDRH